MWRALVALALGIGGAALAADPLPVQPREVPAVAGDILLPTGAVRRFGDIHFRHPGGVSASALSPDGKRLATAASQSVVLWDTATGAASRRFDTGRGFARPSAGLAFAPEGMTLAAVMSPTEAFVWDVATGKELWRTVDEPAGKSGFNGFVGFTAGGGQLVLGRATETEFRDTRTWGVVRSVSVVARLVSPVGPTLVGHEGINGDVSLAGLSRNAAVTGLKVQARAGGLALSPDGRTLATFSLFGRLELWSVPDGRAVRSADVSGDVTSGLVAFAPDGRTLFLATREGLTGWDVGSMKVVVTIARPSPASVTGMHVLPDGETLVVCSTDGFIRRFQWRGGKPLPGPAGYTNSLRAAATADGRRLAVGDTSGRVDVWDTTSGERVAIVSESGEAVYRLAYSPDGQTLAVGRLGGGTIELRDRASGRETRQIRAPGSEREPRAVRTLAFSPDGRTLAAASWWGPLQTWDAPTAARRWAGDPTPVSAFSPDGSVLACSGHGPAVVLLDSATGKERRRVELARDRRNRDIDQIAAMAFSPDGRWLAVATGDGRVRLCDAETGSERAALPAVDPPAESTANPRVRFSNGVESMAFSADGKWLLAGGPDGSVRLWEVDTRQEARRLAGHERPVTFVAFGPGGTTALSAGDDGCAYQWNLELPVLPVGRSAWDDLAAADAAVGYRAAWTLIADPAAAVRTLREKLPPAAEPKPEELARLIARLDANEFAAREAAARALADLGPLAAPALQAALAGKPSAETRERITKLLNRMATEPSAADRRAIRAVLVLERIGTAEARALLTEWANGAPAARLTQEAKGALARMAPK